MEKTIEELRLENKEKDDAIIELSNFYNYYKNINEEEKEKEGVEEEEKQEKPKEKE